MTNVSTKVSDERLKEIVAAYASWCAKHKNCEDADTLSCLRELLSYREHRNEFKLAMWLLGADDMYLSEELLQKAEKILAENPGKSVEQLCAEMLFGPPLPEPKAELKEEDQ